MFDFQPLKAYLRHANAVRELLIESLRQAPIRLAVVLKRAALQSDASVGGGGRGPKIPRRVGAFEVQVRLWLRTYPTVKVLLTSSGTFVV